METAAELPWTGERFVPHVGGILGLEHVHRYRISAPLVTGRDVLDIACGEGYGSAMLALTASSVVGVDVDATSVDHARAVYAGKHLRFEVGDCTAIPIGDASVDAIVSFETIEHLAEHDEMMAEFVRVLRPGGLLIMSSPDKEAYTDVPRFTNPFHVRELYTEEFRVLLRQKFANVELWGQQHRMCSAVTPIDRPEANGVHVWAVDLSSGGYPSGTVKSPDYILALASNAPLPIITSSLLEESYVLPAEPAQESAAPLLDEADTHQSELPQEQSPAPQTVSVSELDRLEAELVSLRGEVDRLTNMRWMKLYRRLLSGPASPSLRKLAGSLRSGRRR